MQNFKKKMTHFESAQEFVKTKFSKEKGNRISLNEKRHLVRTLLKEGLLTPEGLVRVTIRSVSSCLCLEI